MFSSDHSVDNLGRQKQRKWLNENRKLNENDDKADRLDGIAETKGQVNHTSGSDINRLKIKAESREKQVKLNRMLQDMRGYIERENKRKEAFNEKDENYMEVIDS